MASETLRVFSFVYDHVLERPWFLLSVRICGLTVTGAVTLLLLPFRQRVERKKKEDEQGRESITFETFELPAGPRK